MFGLTTEELAILRPLKTPQKIQDFLETIPTNFEPDGDGVLSPRRVLRDRRAHCIEAAMLAALAFRVHGHPPLLLDLTASSKDFDHVIAPFQHHGHWGAISKSNHAVLRYRDPIYKTIRELVLSYFHEYTNDDGLKTLRSYSRPINLSRFDARGWMTAEEDVWYIADHLVEVRHIPLLSRGQISRLRNADPIEQETGKITQWKKPA